MIVLRDVTKTTGSGLDSRRVLESVNVEIPTNRRISVFGPTEVERKVFIDMLAGMTLPSSGRITRSVAVSFPVGFVGGFNDKLSTRKNIAHVARLHSADIDQVVDFIRLFINIGDLIDVPFGVLPRTLRKQIAIVLGYSIPFDVYLLHNDPIGRDKNRENPLRPLYEARAESCGMIVATRNLRFAREYCDMGLVLCRGQVLIFNDMESSIAAYEETMREYATT